MLLVLTLCAIYSYNRANEIIAELSDTLPPAVLNLFEDILKGGGRHGDGGPSIGV
ncbi:hypothetical protein Agau_C201268 [Agrobacterium tumefaciens F2]|nr:hypothetical protein Agau_C201268 [Agrobacterium tumefaciens F2]